MVTKYVLWSSNEYPKRPFGLAVSTPDFGSLGRVFIDIDRRRNIIFCCILYNNKHKPSRAFILTNKSKLTIIKQLSQHVQKKFKTILYRIMYIYITESTSNRIKQ